jgi:outer membrane protein assembly factor BamB
MTSSTPASCIALLTLWTSATEAANWPQFRGPNASGVDTSATLPVRWDLSSGENVLWKIAVPGLSHASPVIWGDRVYVATAVSPGKADLKVGLYGDIEPLEENQPQDWRLLAYDKATGKEVWNVSALKGVPRSKRHPKATHCNSTPATDGSAIVALFGSEGIFCFDPQGKLLWKKDLGPLDAGYFEVPSAQWGFGSSPVIHQGKVIVLCDVQTNSFLAALDLKSGRELWRTPRNDVPTWGTPAIVTAANRVQIIVNGWHHSAGYDYSTGKELWWLKEGGDIPVPTPIFANSLIYLTSAHGKLRPMRAIRPEASGDITPPDPAQTNGAIAWVHERQGNYMQTPIAVSNWVFACVDFGLVTCFQGDTGKIQYSERLPGGAQGYTASPVSDGRHLYFPGESGRVLVVPVSNRFSCVATNSMGEECMASPAISEGSLFFRTRNQLVALRETKKSASTTINK